MELQKSGRSWSLIIVEDYSSSITSDRIRTLLYIRRTRRGVEVTGKRSSVDGEECFYCSGDIAEAGPLSEAIDIGTSEGLLDAPSKLEIANELAALHPRLARELAALEAEKMECDNED
jgi:hypothetical protein